MRKYLENFITDDKIVEDINIVKRWSILDLINNMVYDVTDKEFGNALLNETIKLRGKYILQNGNEIWIDAVTNTKNK